MTQRQKNGILIAGLLIAFVVAYVFSIKKTLTLRSELGKLTQQEALYQSAPAQLALLTNKEKQLDSILLKNNVSGTSLQQDLLNMLHQQIQLQASDTGMPSFRILAFETPHEHTDSSTGSVTVSYDFTLEGNYQSLISVLYALEQQYSFGNVVHVAFDKKKNYRTGKLSLECRVLLQRIR